MAVWHVTKTRLKKAGRFVLAAGLAGIVIFVSLPLYRAFQARGFEDLHAWHRIMLPQEFGSTDDAPDMTLQRYLDIEARVFEELEETFLARAQDLNQDPYNRYDKASLSSPARFAQNWNRSFERTPSPIKGGVLLLHGLTDSPYSMRSVASVFHDNGFYVLALRMPGHGTVPAALTTVTWQDWLAAAKVGVRHVRQKIGPGLPFFLGGYSNGAAVSLLYSLMSLDDRAFARPDRLVLFSPALAISNNARVAPWLEMTSVIPYFEKAKWKSVGPEYDPFKYNSFPLNAATQSYQLAKKVQRMLRQSSLDGTLKAMPTILTFQSLMDSTVIAEAVVTELYDRLSPGGHELVAFDINQNALMANFIKTSPLKKILEARSSERLPYTLTLITNASKDSDAVVARTKRKDADSFDEMSLNLRWPEGVYSLSHVAIPFPVDDPLYGLESPEPSPAHIQLGRIHLRGEKRGLRISETAMLRLRCNPFWDYIEARLVGLIQETVR